ncbi:MAG: LPS export ABC transporter permease LptG [Deltaproteobacteria bacterium]|nr:LPS export ABC transporter permease LptG [Deltaproteobacteria bacterium]MBQ7248664.1 LPS export ABC transporter permease LptG [Deltaproteobacteria bacterium]
MHILDRYVITRFLNFFFLALAAFSGVYLLVDFIEKLDNFIDNDAPWSLCLLFFLNKLPMIFSQVTPLAVLLGSFLTVASLSRNGELIAMFSGGVGLRRVLTPIFVLALLVVAANFAINEYLLPITTEKMNHILYQEIRKKPLTFMKEGGAWMREKNRLVHITSLEPQGMILQGVAIYTMDERFQIVAYEEANRATYHEGAWIADQVIRRRFDPQTGSLLEFASLQKTPIDFHKPPKEFRRVNAKRDELNYRQLHHLAHRLQAEGFDATSYRVDMHSRLAVPFASFIMVILGIPFALRNSRRAGVAMGMAISVGVGMIYFFAQATLTAFGYSALLPPLVAAWSANIIFMLLGIGLFLNLEQ